MRHIFSASWLAWSGCILLSGVAALDNGVGLRPPMGYNSWNHLMCKNMNEKNIKSIADAMVSHGLQELGYEYLNLDDCWVDKVRDAQGRLQGNPKRFPSGMKALGDYIHSKGLKFGIYTDRGTKTCASVGPGSKGNEALDARTFAEWGVDYVKEDDCYNGAIIPGLPVDVNQTLHDFGLFRDGLNASGRPIFFNVCGGGWTFPFISDIRWYATDARGGQKLANSWRITADCTGWWTCQAAMNTGAELGKYAGEGGFNDADMLLGTNPDAAFTLSKAQSRTQFNVWSILMAPLFVGAPIDQWSMSSAKHWYDMTTYTNHEVIAVNQDPLMKAGFKAYDAQSTLKLGSVQVWVRELSQGAFALVFVNTYPWSSTVKCDAKCWSRFTQSGAEFSVRDLWWHAPAEVPTAKAGQDYSVKVGASGASAMFKLTPKVILV